MRKISRILNKNIAFYCFMLASVLIPAMYATFSYNKTMPFAEGWYTYYAQLINEKGLMPYRDFEYLFSPVYIYFIAIFTRVFGYKIVALRWLGIFMYGLIAWGIFLVITEIVGRKKAWIAAISAVTAVIYLQSESVQIFYDYIRLMDIFAVFTIFFLLRTIKKMQQEQDKHARLSLLICSFFNALFINVKQNMGLIFCAYVIALILYLDIYFRHSIKKIVGDVLLFLLPVSGITALIYATLALSGGLRGYLSMTGSGAISAKGGMLAILFNWIPNNMTSFRGAWEQAVPAIVLVIGLIIGGAIMAAKKIQAFSLESNHKLISLGNVYGGLYLLLVFSLWILAGGHKELALPLSAWWSITPYWIFEVVFLAFLFMGGWLLYNILLKHSDADNYILWFTLAGAYVAISWGCGNSGGLAEGQATTGVAFIIAFVMYWLSLSSVGTLVSAAVVASCVIISTQAGVKKMVNTYNWWGADEADLWSSKFPVEDVPLLKGFYVSEDTKSVYESICKEITSNVSESESIYCFPQIPIFYSLCDRWDPGVFSKVQWFDVSTDASVEADIDVLKENPPKAVLMYDVNEYVYNSHESLFRKGAVSGTRKMREFLYNFVYANDYEFVGIYTTGNNTLQLWIKRDLTNTTAENIFDSGDGTFNDPYTLHTAEQLEILSAMVNEGRSFEGQYIEQTADIDLANRNYTPIGEYDGGNYFYGTYNGAGHVIRNLNISTENDNAALFGRLGGQVYNLGIEGGSITGSCVGGIASHAVGDNAAIINSYTDISVAGTRAGGIADNFAGVVKNCFSAGVLHGLDNAGVLSYNLYQEVQNVYEVEKNSIQDFYTASIKENRVTYCSSENLEDETLVERLNLGINQEIEATLQKLDSEGDENTVEWVFWKQGKDGHPVFDLH